MSFSSESSDNLRPLVSVVMPAYNAADRLPSTLNSVLAQSYPSDRLEIIVVDDGSEDGTAVRARNCLSDAAVATEVLSIENSGPSRARNIGWTTAEGDWIQFLDDDDRLAREKIEVQVGTAEEASENVAVVHSDWSRMSRNEEGNWVETGIARPRISDDEPLIDLLSSEGFIHLGSGLFRREWLEEVEGFDERYWLIEDVHLMLRIAKDGGQFAHVSSEKPLFFYRNRGEASLSGRSRGKFARACARNAQLVEEYWREHNVLTSRRVQFLVRAYFYAARELANCNWDECMRVWNHIQELTPRAIPPKPRSLRLLTRCIGYPAAQRIVVWVRGTKEALRSFLPLGSLKS